MSLIRSARSSLTREHHAAAAHATSFAESVTEDTSGTGAPSFITVRYGDNQEAIFNSWCPGYTLLNCIRSKCNADKDVTLDLCDLQGHVRNLAGHPHDYANTFIDGRKTYVLVKVEKQGENEPSKYTSLLNDIDILIPELTEKLNNVTLSRHGRRHDRAAHSQGGAGKAWTAMKAATRFGGRALRSRDGKKSKDSSAR